MKKYAVLILVILAGLALAVIGTTPPPPTAGDSDPATFSAKRAMADVKIIARAPHPTGSAENAVVRGHIIARLTELGLEVTTTEASVPQRSLDRFGRWSGETPSSLTLTNIIGVLPGTDRSLPAVALMAHHDTVWASPGAPDDSAGVASILEALRALKQGGPLKRDIIVLLSDGEELGLLGAKQFFGKNGTGNPLSDRIGAIINLEARGGGGRTTLFQTSKGDSAAVQIYADAVGRPAGSSLSAFIYEQLPNDTDLTPALERDYAAYNFGFIGRPGLYHSPKATPDNLDQGSVQDMGDQVLGLTRALANAEALPAATDNRTFFDAFGLTLIHYGAIVGWLLFASMAMLQLYSLRLNEAKGDWLKGLGASAIVILGGGVLLFLFNKLSGADAGEGIYYDRLAAIPKLEAQALLICVGVLAASAPLWAGKRGSILGVLIAAALQLFAPTTSYIIVWPLLLSGLATVLVEKSAERWGGAIKVVFGALVLGFLLQYGHQLMQGVGPDTPWVVALMAALFLPMLGLLASSIDRKKAFAAAGICLVLAGSVALWVRFDPVADTVAAYSSIK